MSEGVDKSQFYMWRTLFAVAHADNVVTDEEISFMAQILEDVDFSDAQTQILKDDIINAKNVEDMFAGITSENDRVKFFEFARDLVWVDGDFGSEEQTVMIKLYQTHMKDTNVDEMIGKISLQLEDDQPTQRPDSEYMATSSRKGGVRGFVSAFGQWFKGYESND